MTTVITFYEGSYPFSSETTALKVNPSYIEYCLAKQYEYRPTSEVLWAELNEKGVRSRFSFTYGKPLEQSIFVGTKRYIVIGESETQFKYKGSKNEDCIINKTDLLF